MHTVSLTDFLEGLRENDGTGASATAFTFDMEFIDGNKGSYRLCLQSKPLFEDHCGQHLIYIYKDGP